VWPSSTASPPSAYPSQKPWDRPARVKGKPGHHAICATEPYFTLPSLAAHVHAVWRDRFSPAERAAFRDFLAREGYDPANEDLLANETMAYLLFTPDPRFFAPNMVGMTESAVERLRGLLRDGAPLP
jgi:hypothetical protein